MIVPVSSDNTNFGTVREPMRLVIIEALIGVLLVLLPVMGALFGYVSAAFLRLGTAGTFWVTNTGAIILSPTPVIIADGPMLTPAGFVLLNAVVGRSSTVGVILALGSMACLTFVNMGISKYIKG